MTSQKLLGKTYVINGVAEDVSEFSCDMSADIYYEVVRMIDGKILFLKDHLNRLRDSLFGTELTFPGQEAIIESLKLLQNTNDFKLGNIRICLQRKGEDLLDLLCYFVPYIYPETCAYLTGVQLATYPHVRSDPGIKKWDNQFRVSVNQYIRDHGVYEALLLNDKRQITEGSRSNLFFLDRNQNLFTPPEKNVLPGITRKQVIELCNRKGLEVLERPVQLSELDQMETVFITGTSPKILPVWQIDSHQFKVDHPLLRMLMEDFEAVIEKNLSDLNRD